MRKNKKGASRFIIKPGKPWGGEFGRKAEGESLIKTGRVLAGRLPNSQRLKSGEGREQQCYGELQNRGQDKNRKKDVRKFRHNDVMERKGGGVTRGGAGIPQYS